MTKRYLHNRGCYHLLTGDMGLLMPIGLWEILPGETVQHRTDAVIRLSPMAAPVMHPITVRTHSFFVSMRNAWGDDCGKAWERFITGGPDGKDATVPPAIQTTRNKNDLLDYLGVPPVDNVKVNALPVRAVNQIWNEYYRDQDLQTERTQDDLTVPQIAWEKDRFTVARPWPQKGDQITLPTQTRAPVRVDVASTSAASLGVGYTDQTAAMRASTPEVQATNVGSTTNAELYADLSQGAAVTVNEFRRAMALQRLQEQRARYGSRYTEFLRYSFGVTPEDARLQRPEYLGGGKVRLAIREVLQTANEQTPGRYGVGDLYGHGIGGIRSNTYRYHAREWGYIVTLLSVRPKAMYMDGVDRMWLKEDREEYFQRELQYIGQQAVYQGEVSAAAGTERNTFGWNDRYSEYRSSRSRVSAEFRDQLKYWHMGREFSVAPSLNEEFIRCSPTKRIFNVQTNHALWMMVQHQMATKSVVDRSAYGKII